jgi:predicted oxidoreductase
MSLTPTASPVAGMTGTVPEPSGVRRVRHQARDVVALMAFSAASSTAVAVGFLLVAHLSRAGR